MIVRKPRRARGFTLIELLVVIGVILILVGLAVYAFNKLDPSEKATVEALQNVRAMFAELEASSGFGEVQRINAISDATLREQEMFRSMFKLPANRNALTKMSAKMVKQGDPPRVLDAWGNEIKYYAYDLTGVSLGLKADGSFLQTNQTITSPDGRPFFASPGKDANMTNGDDNVYSFTP